MGSRCKGIQWLHFFRKNPKIQSRHVSAYTRAKVTRTERRGRRARQRRPAQEPVVLEAQGRPRAANRARSNGPSLTYRSRAHADCAREPQTPGKPPINITYKPAINRCRRRRAAAGGAGPGRRRRRITSMILFRAERIHEADSVRNNSALHHRPRSPLVLHGRRATGRLRRVAEELRAQTHGPFT
ncbi:hypothetical protein EVAR_80911_1 [Eumeta japonica]|uniref:Uncharacterized protein n=1 Tax=Eumeta variegata TaxID=151549 RepID=A0A4C1V229_EUMVA|nr:hypothetical protein EVAR_80911_1 [Eumeta japonica]